MSGEFFLAGKYLKPKRNAVSIITLISIIGVALGVAVLLIVQSVMTGFTDMMKEKLLETQSHMQIKEYNNQPLANAGYVVERALANGALNATTVVQAPILLQKDKTFLPKALLGITPEELAKSVDIDSVIKHGEKTLGRGDIWVSTAIARQFQLHLGSKVAVHSQAKLANLVEVQNDGQIARKENAELYLPSEFTVSAIFSFGKYDFDGNVVFVSLDDADDLFDLPWGSGNAVYVWVEDPFNMKSFEAKMNEDLPQLWHASWQESNQQILGVLQMEENMMFFLLIFIVLVAAFSITNTLITTVYQKTHEIGLLKSLGASHFVIMKIFLLQGALVGLIGSICGIILGAVVLFYRNDILHFTSKLAGHDLFPKEFYVFNELPAHIVPEKVVIIAVTSIILCTLGALIPAWRAATLDPAKALRYE